MTGPALEAVLADRLPDLLAPVLGSGLRVGQVVPLSGGASRQTWGVGVRDGDGRQHELVLRAGDPRDPGDPGDPAGRHGPDGSGAPGDPGDAPPRVLTTCLPAAG